MPKLLQALFGIQSPPAPRNDLVTIFLTGIPGLNQPPGVTPSEMLRLNIAIAPVPSPNRFGVLGGDAAGFPNGRRAERRRGRHRAARDGRRDAADARRSTTGINAQLGDGVDANDMPFLDVFPYLGLPHPGNR